MQKKSILYLAGSLCISLVSMWAVMVWTFPSEVLKDWLQAELRAHVPLRIEIKEVNLRWNGLHISESLIYPTEDTVAGVPIAVAFPVTWRWFYGIPFQIWQGPDTSIDGLAPWNSETVPSQVQGKIALKDALPWLNPALQDNFEFAGVLDFDLKLYAHARRLSIEKLYQTKFHLQATLENVEVAASILSTLGIPSLSLRSCTIDLSSENEPVVMVNTFTCQGMAQISITGMARPDLMVPGQSQVHLELTLALDPSWYQRIKPETHALIKLYVQSQNPNLEWDQTTPPPPLKFKLQGYIAKPNVSPL